MLMHLNKLATYTIFLASLSIAQSQVTRFVVTESGSDNPLGTTASLTSGQTVTVRVTALGADDAVVTNYKRNVTVASADLRYSSASWATGVVPANSFSNGVADGVSLFLVHAGTQDRRITATDGNVTTYDANNYGIASITLTDFGTGYTSVPDVRLVGGGGSGAMATAVLNIDTGEVSAVIVTAPGKFFKSQPQVIFSGGNPKSPARALANLAMPFSIHPASFSVTRSGTTQPLTTEVIYQGEAVSFRLSALNIDGTLAQSYAGLVNISSERGNTLAASFPMTAADRGILDFVPNVRLAPAFNTRVGTAARATATFQSPSVSTVSLTNGGSGYTSQPSVNFSGGEGSGAAATVTLSRPVASLGITNGGFGYTQAPRISFTGGGGSDAAATAIMSVNKIVIINGGSGYTTNVTVSINGGLGVGGVAAQAVPIINGGVLTGITLVNNGSGYISPPNITVSGGASNAVLQPTMTVTGVNLINGGSGYATAPVVSIADPTPPEGELGQVARAVATLGSGSISSITLTNAGAGYLSTPTVLISGGGGTGATAVASIQGGGVTGITVNSGSTGYTTAPQVLIYDGGGVGAAATATVAGGEVTSITVRQSGKNYTSTPTVTILPPNLTDRLILSDGVTTTTSGLLTYISPGLGIGQQGIDTGAMGPVVRNLIGSALNISNVTIPNTPDTDTIGVGRSLTINFTVTFPKSGVAAVSGTSPSPGTPPTVLVGPLDFVVSIPGVRPARVQFPGLTSSIVQDTSITLSASVTLPATLPPATYTATVRAGLTNAGNTGSVEFTTTDTPDLSIVRFDHAAGQFYGGDAMRFDLAWRNFNFLNPGRTTGRFPRNTVYRVEIHLSPNTTFGDADDIVVWQNDYREVFDLLDQQSVVVSDEFLLPKNVPGSYYLLAKVNSAGGRAGSFATGTVETFGPAVSTPIYNGNNVWLGLEAAKITLLPTQTADVNRQSLTSTGVQSAGISDRPVISADGRFVFFHSYGALAGVTAGNSAANPQIANIYARDTVLNTISLITASVSSAASNGSSLYPRSTRDGRYVVFQSDASNLVSGDTNGYTDIFIKDTRKQTVIRLTRPDGVQFDQGSYLPDIDSTGQFVVFETTATNVLKDLPANGLKQIYIYNRYKDNDPSRIDVAGNTEFTAISSLGGVWGATSSFGARISGTRNHDVFVVFTASGNSNLTSIGSPYSQVIRWQRNGRKLVTVSRPQSSSAELADGDTAFPVINYDGSYIVYASRSKNLTFAPNDSGAPHLFRAKISNDQVSEVIRINAANGDEPNNDFNYLDLGNFEPSLSDDGKIIAFVSESDNLLPSIPVRHIDRTIYLSAKVQNYSDRTFASDIYVVNLSDVTEPKIFRASVSRFGFEASPWFETNTGSTLQVTQSRSPALSADGRYVVFVSDAKGFNGLEFGATNFDGLATNAVTDVYLFDNKVGLGTPAVIDTLPTVSLISPTTRTFTTGSTLLFQASANTSNANTSIKGVEFFIDGVSIGQGTADSNDNQVWSAFKSLRNLALGEHSAVAMVTDSKDYVVVSTPVTFSVRQSTTGSPTIELVQSSKFAILESTVPINFTATSAPGVNLDNIRIYGSGSVVASYSNIANSSFSSTYSFVANTVGKKSFYAVVVDEFGNQSTSIPIDYTVNQLFNSSFVKAVYTDFFTRSTTSEELVAASQLDEGIITRSQLVYRIVTGTVFNSSLSTLRAYQAVVGSYPDSTALFNGQTYFSTPANTLSGYVSTLLASSAYTLKYGSVPDLVTTRVSLYELTKTFVTPIYVNLYGRVPSMLEVNAFMASVKTNGVATSVANLITSQYQSAAGAALDNKLRAAAILIAQYKTVPTNASVDKLAANLGAYNGRSTLAGGVYDLLYSAMPSNFPVETYLNLNPDVRDAFKAEADQNERAWLHYIRYGINEGRAFDAGFRVDEYLQLYSDLKKAFGSDRLAAVLHWLTYGKSEGRLGRVPALFKVDDYLNRYSDLNKVFDKLTAADRSVSSYNHYVFFGAKEGRSYDDVFRAREYVTLYSDLTRTFGKENFGTGAEHWLLYGASEGRLGRVPVAFDAAGYLARYSDLKAAFAGLTDGIREATAFNHYILSGSKEGRLFNDEFNPSSYLSRYSDLRGAFGTDLGAATLHWLIYGKSEGRIGK